MQKIDIPVFQIILEESDKNVTATIWPLWMELRLAVTKVGVFETTWWLPSGELTFCHGKSPFLMGKSTISMAIFHCYVSSPEGMWFSKCVAGRVCPVIQR